MKWMSLNELRNAFLTFFESKNHLKLDSFPLIPKDDKSLLIINSGMAPMKKWFLGKETPPKKRVTTCQKCIRTPDIERVGKTSRHGTFFEMLGNFSFGDYFKADAIKWAYEFLTKVLEIEEEKLYITVFHDDDEAYNIWLNDIKIKKSHLSRLGREDNFWEIGTGPCGPCSEIYYDRGEKFGCGNENCAPGCECDRFVEIWNLVFSQYNSDGNGNYSLMENPNIDTGMGLERLACIVQNVDNLFLVDSISKIIDNISNMLGKNYGESDKLDVAFRIITDHIRSITFMIADGIIPSNEGRGYVLRRLIRRAYRNGRVLGFSEPFLYKILKTVIEVNKSAYPYLVERESYIEKIIKVEEENFDKILERGMNILSKAIDNIDSNFGTLSGKDAFILCDTYGFPFELIKDIALERNFKVDEKEFLKLMEHQKVMARSASQNDSVGWKLNNISLPNEDATLFVGYDTFKCEAKLLHIFTKDGETQSISSNEDCILIFDKTPFYAEGGGQVGDIGIIKFKDSVLEVYDCQKLSSGQFIHKAKVIEGSFKNKEVGLLAINEKRRLDIARNHSAAHLLQSALREVLGNHVHQAGQLVDDKKIRFDFNHFEGLTKEELSKVEQIINFNILKGIPVSTFNTDIKTAKEKGAMALFSEKYGDTVRVVDMKEASIELCGGTHIDNTSKIGLFQILSESSASAGIRRIEATTGFGVLNLINEFKSCLINSSHELKLENYIDLPSKIKSLKNDLKEANKKIESLNSKLVNNNLDKIFKDNLNKKGDFYILSYSFDDISKDELREFGDKAKSNFPNIIAVFVSLNKKSNTLLVVCGNEAVKNKADANFIVKSLTSILGGGGGGKKNSAMAGFKDLDKLDYALSNLPSIIDDMLKQ